MDPNTPTQQPTPDFIPAAPTSNKKKWWFLGGIIVVAVLIIAAAVWYLQMQAVDQESAAPAPTAQVDISKNLVPATIHISKGQSVTWTNTTDRTHNLVAKSDDDANAVDGFGTPNALKNGENYSYTFDTVGTFTYSDPSDPTHFSGTVVVQ